MKATVTHYFSDETNEHLASQYFIDGEKVSLEDYTEFVEEYMVDDCDDCDDEVDCQDGTEEYDDCACSQSEACEQCNCDECPCCENTECCDEDRECDCDCEDEDLEEEYNDFFCTCEGCTEEREQNVISEFLDMLFNPNGACADCIIEKFIDTVYMFKNFGVREAKQEMREFLED